MQLVRYSEPLEQEELAFLMKKERKERNQYFKLIKWLMVFCFLCPFAVAWMKAIEGAEDPFSYITYFGGVFFLACFAGSGTYFVYYYNLRKIQSDIRHKTKTIERAHITRKQFMPHNNTYHFYIDSPNRLSIEVTAIDFHRLDKGDELSIEYTTYSKLYLGYF
jgi:glucan phosphoethanolaminetransferase (alkaline phosphatase superfamily)